MKIKILSQSLEMSKLELSKIDNIEQFNVTVSKPYEDSEGLELVEVSGKKHELYDLLFNVSFNFDIDLI